MPVYNPDIDTVAVESEVARVRRLQQIFAGATRELSRAQKWRIANPEKYKAQIARKVNQRREKRLSAPSKRERMEPIIEAATKARDAGYKVRMK